ncbi:MAG: proline--tRNA ligase, partial [Gorillibacterium sp.]|nr:proline--tRNA ligase [Gorillibacterium sp.]
VELGPRDMENGQVVVVSRVSGEKKMIAQENLAEQITTLLTEVHNDMFEKAKKFRDEHFSSVETMDELAKFLEEAKGFALAGWCGSDACEAQVKEETGATSRNIPFNPAEHKKVCLVCGEAAKHTVLFGRAY